MKIYACRKAYFTVFAFYLFLTCGLFQPKLQAQVQPVSAVGWLYLQNEHQFSENWSLHTDVHGRSSEKFKDFGNLLIRNWIDLSIGEDWSAGVGYAFLGSWDEEIGAPDNYYPEHRTFQQIQHRIISTATSTIKHRGRFEQRFFRTPLLPALSLRARYALNWKRQLTARPLGAEYVFLENEVFLNTKGRSLSGGQVFEQNRAYAGIGYPFIGSSDLELGTYYEIQNDVFRQTNQTLIFQLLIKMRI